MPRLVSEISSGAQFQRSSEQGRMADSQVRVFRILLEYPGEVINPQEACQITIGQPHPINSNIYCVSWDIKYEGDSRAVAIATFNYQSTPSSQSGGQDPKGSPPDIRPANWSTSTSLMEAPVYTWQEIRREKGQVINQQQQNGQPRRAPDRFVLDGGPVPAMNFAGDMYDGISRYDAVVTISIEQYCQDDPTLHVLEAGSVNKEEIKLGTLTMQPGSVLFRGVQSRPTIESWGDLIYRGWTATYEFAYRKNHVKGLYDRFEKETYEADIGWDVAVPATGFNVKCFLNGNDVDNAGMPLKQDGTGKIDGWPNAVSLPDGVAAGQKARAMVLVHAYANGGASQLPSAQPIPINQDGSPRVDTADPKVLVFRYRVLPMVDFTKDFKLRLF